MWSFLKASTLKDLTVKYNLTIRIWDERDRYMDFLIADVAKNQYNGWDYTTKQLCDIEGVDAAIWILEDMLQQVKASRPYVEAKMKQEKRDWELTGVSD